MNAFHTLVDFGGTGAVSMRGKERRRKPEGWAFLPGGEGLAQLPGIRMARTPSLGSHRCGVQAGCSQGWILHVRFYSARLWNLPGNDFQSSDETDSSLFPWIVFLNLTSAHI